MPGEVSALAFAQLAELAEFDQQRLDVIKIFFRRVAHHSSMAVADPRGKRKQCSEPIFGRGITDGFTEVR